MGNLHPEALLNWSALADPSGVGSAPWTGSPCAGGEPSTDLALRGRGGSPQRPEVPGEGMRGVSSLTPRSGCPREEWRAPKGPKVPRDPREEQEV